MVGFLEGQPGAPAGPWGWTLGEGPERGPPRDDEPRGHCSPTTHLHKPLKPSLKEMQTKKTIHSPGTGQSARRPRGKKACGKLSGALQDGGAGSTRLRNQEAPPRGRSEPDPLSCLSHSLSFPSTDFHRLYSLLNTP